MASSVTALQNGLLYQETIFWFHAARMLVPDNEISTIIWEDDDVIGFDDVVVEYNDGKKMDEVYGTPINSDYIQVKHHVDKSKQFTTEALIDPAFIGATSVSLLQKLQKQYCKQTAAGKTARYILINTWGLAPGDLIGSLIGDGGAIRLSVLFDGTTDKSKTGKVRKAWREHLGLQTDNELKEILRSLRIRADYADLHNFQEMLNIALNSAGLIPFPADRLSNRYFSLIPRLHGQKKNKFNADELRQLCKTEDLALAIITDSGHRVGIRTFMQGAEKLEKETNSMLCLSHLYDGRKIKNKDEWSQQVFPAIKQFLGGLTAKEDKIVFSLETHLSLAFAVGYCIDPKLGVQASILQKTQNGKLLWQPEFGKLPSVQQDHVSWNEVVLDTSQTDIAVTISITHETLADVNCYVADSLPCVGRILEARINPEPSHLALRDGTHVLLFAQAIARKIAAARSVTERSGRVHFFMAAPNAFAFFLGQYSKVLGNMVVYEFNFPPVKAGDYQPVLTFPN